MAVDIFIQFDANNVKVFITVATSVAGGQVWITALSWPSSKRSFSTGISICTRACYH